MMRSARHLIIHGRVQGVFYRKWALRTARHLGLTGWVRNRAEGSVEAWIEGDPAALDAFIAEARRGPSAANVVRIESTEGEARHHQGFEQRPTA
ncbi:MAG: acylphosphatase [Sphingobium yanoikuyae]|nr:acylphosphatase [Sphingobium yanoikuyae]